MLFLPFSPEFEAVIGDDFAFDGSEPRWLCRFLDAHACTSCGSTDLSAHDAPTYLQCDGPYLPRSSLACLACGGSCYGPLDIECYGLPGPPLAYLAPKFGAPLAGRLCVGCGFVWLSLSPEDNEARLEFATRVADGGPCDRCALGRLRATPLDVPHAGFGGLYDLPTPLALDQESTRVADLLVVVCDSCGEAQARADWLDSIDSLAGASG